MCWFCLTHFSVSMHNNSTSLDGLIKDLLLLIFISKLFVILVSKKLQNTEQLIFFIFINPPL